MKYIGTRFYILKYIFVHLIGRLLAIMIKLLIAFKGTGCPKINFTFLNVNNVRTNIRIATPAIYIDTGNL